MAVRAAGPLVAQCVREIGRPSDQKRLTVFFAVGMLAREKLVCPCNTTKRKLIAAA